MKLTGCSQMIYHRAIALHYSRRSYFTQDIPCRIYQAGILSPGVKINVFFMSLEAGNKSAFCRLISLCIFHCCCFSCFNGRRVPAIIANNSCSFNAKLNWYAQLYMAKPSKQLNLNVMFCPMRNPVNPFIYWFVLQRE